MSAAQTRQRDVQGSGEDSPLASLSRKLAALETRLDRLPGQRAKAAAPATEMPVPATPGPVAATMPAPIASLPIPENRRAALADAVSEIVMRRQMLDIATDRAGASRTAAARVEHRAAAGGRRARQPASLRPVANPLGERLQALAGEAQALQGEGRDLRVLSEVASEIQLLREELREETGRERTEARFDEMRRAFDDLRTMIGQRADAGLIGDELAFISSSLAQLTEAGADRATLNALRAELEEVRNLFRESAEEASAVASRESEAKAELKKELERLRESLRTLASEDQVRAVEKRWDQIEEHFRRPIAVENVIPPALKGEIETMRRQLDTLADAGPSRVIDDARWGALEERLDQREVEASVERLAQRMGDIERTLSGLPGLGDRLAEIESRLHSLPGSLGISSFEDRLRDISGAVDALTRRSEETDLDSFLSLEERLDEISRAIVAVSVQPAPTFDMAPIERIEARLSTLSARVDSVAETDGRTERLSKRMAELSDRLEELATSSAGVELASRVETLTGRFETALAEFEAPVVDTSAIEARIEALSARFEDTLSQIERPAFDAEAIEQRLAALTKKLESNAASQVDPEMVQALEGQISRLADHLTKAASLQEDFEVDIDRRLASVEKRLEENRDALIAAAREAAEETARRMQEVGDRRQAEHVAQLTQNLRSLEALSTKSDDRSTKVFEAVHTTLLKIVDRLERIEADLGDKSVVAAAPAARDAEIVRPAPEPVEAAAPTALAIVETIEEDKIPAVLKAGADAGIAARARLSTPTLDTADMVDRREINRPLEPGSGVPDIGALLERVRSAQRSKAGGDPLGEAETRAAARKAAKAASAEAAAIRDPEAATAGGKFSLGGLLARRRKAVVTGVVAVIVALSALPIGRAVFETETEGPTLDLTATVLPSTPAEPAAVETAAVDAPAPATEAPAAAPATEEVAALPATPAAEPAMSAMPSSMNASPAKTPAPTVVAPEAPAAASEPATEAAAPAPAAIPATASAPVPAPGSALAAALSHLPEAAQAKPAVPEGIGPEALVAAAKAGDAKADFEVGLRLMEGRAGQPDPAAALPWFAEAARHDFAPAQYSLGTMFEKGTGVSRDTVAARDWYLLAAGQGNVRAMHNLAVLYATGVDGKSEPETAVRYFNDAAQHGMRDSQYNLGILYARGSGVDQDLVQSYKWFGIVANGGDKDAAAKRDEVGRSLKPEQLEAAKAAVAGFSPMPRVEMANTVETPAAWNADGSAAAAPVTTGSVDMTRAVRNIQAILTKLGFDPGTPDGIMGAKTKGAIAAFQRQAGLDATGEVDAPLVKALLQRKDG